MVGAAFDPASAPGLVATIPVVTPPDFCPTSPPRLIEKQQRKGKKAKNTVEGEPPLILTLLFSSLTRPLQPAAPTRAAASSPSTRAARCWRSRRSRRWVLGWAGLRGGAVCCEWACCRQWDALAAGDVQLGLLLMGVLGAGCWALGGDAGWPCTPFAPTAILLHSAQSLLYLRHVPPTHCTAPPSSLYRTGPGGPWRVPSHRLCKGGWLLCDCCVCVCVCGGELFGE